MASCSSSQLDLLQNVSESHGDIRSLPYIIDAIKRELSDKGIDLDKLEPRSRDRDRVTRLVDLRDYKILEKVLMDLKEDDSQNLIKRCFLTCQPELRHDLVWHDPAISESRRNRICKRYTRRTIIF